jgi:Holliday junction resolvasome RuvABC endonuclease subunit
MNSPRIIAVDPGRGLLGVAIFEGASLRYYAVKTLRVPGTPKAVRRAATRVFSGLIAKYQPSHAAIEQPIVVQRRAALLAHVIGALKTTAKHHGLIVNEYSPQAIRRFICTGAKPTKREVAQRLTARYPELTRHLSPQGRWAELYYERMFGAVAVGLVAYTLSEKQKGRFAWPESK